MPDYGILSSHCRKFGHSSSDDVLGGNLTLSSYGTGCDRQYFVSLKNADGGLSNQFDFVSARKVEKPKMQGLPSARFGKETLELLFKDQTYDLEIRQYYTVFSDCDAIAVSACFTNASNSSVVLKSLYSCQLDLDESGYEIYTYMGAFGRERNRVINRLNEGTFVSEIRCGMSSHAKNPFMMLKSPDRLSGYYAFNLVYSGNHKEVVESSSLNLTRVLIGMNDFGGEKKVEAGESFFTPEAVMTYGDTKNAVTQAMHSFVNEHIIPPQHKTGRLIPINLWSSCTFNFDREMVIKYAQKAKDTGMELLVVDDGWFGNRDSDQTSLGDWTDNIKKTGGLTRLVKDVHKIGLKFGLWVEPEMISPESELYRAHPEYVMRNPKREPILQRNQMVLDLTNPEVEKFIFDMLDRVIGTYQVDYIKWDCNRTMSDAYGVYGCDDDYFYRYVKALYSILERITEKYPSVLFEGCAAGGGRFDLGILYYMPQIWTSDMTDPMNRVLIQEGTLVAYPPSCVSAHVSNALVVGRRSRLLDRFNVSLEGVLGYEYDVTSVGEEETSEISRQVEFYKKYRELLQYGTYYSTESAFDGKAGVRIVVSDDRSKAIASIFKLKNTFNMEQWKYRFMGLDENATYRVRFYGKEKEYIAKGDALNAGKLDLNDLFMRDGSGQYFSELQTLTVIMEKI